jgi:Predicted transcriptional regulators
MATTDLGTGVYGSRLAAKLAGVTLRQLRYWVRKGILKPSVYQAGRGGRDLFSYTDLVQARAIGRLRKQGASLRRIGQAIDYLRTSLPQDHEWHTKTLVMDGGILSLVGPGEVLNTTHQSPGQEVFTVFLGDLTRELLKVGDELSIGHQLEVDRGIQGGSPVIKGTRIPTRLIGELLSEGVGPARIRRMYPGVTAAGITAAQEFERQLAAV